MGREEEKCGEGPMGPFFFVVLVKVVHRKVDGERSSGWPLSKYDLEVTCIQLCCEESGVFWTTCCCLWQSTGVCAFLQRFGFVFGGEGCGGRRKEGRERKRGSLNLCAGLEPLFLRVTKR